MLRPLLTIELSCAFFEAEAPAEDDDGADAVGATVAVGAAVVGAPGAVVATVVRGAVGKLSPARLAAARAL